MLADAESPRRVGLVRFFLLGPHFFLLKNGDDLALTWH